MTVSLLLIEQFYYPDGGGATEIPRDLTIHLSATGYTVEVLCGSEQYAPVQGDPGLDPRSVGVRIRRVPRAPGGNCPSAKVLRQLWFYLASTPMLLFRRPPDIFLAQTQPPMAIVLVAAVARMWRRPLIIVAMDLYPEVLFASQMLRGNGLAGRCLTGMFRWAYRSAARIVSLGPFMTQRLISKGVIESRIVEISNWATGGRGIVRGPTNSLRLTWGLKDRFVLVYSGNLGVGHEFDTLLRAISVARQKIPRLILQIIGQGRRLPEVRSLVDELKLQGSVQVAPLVPANSVPESLGLADLAVVTMRPGFEGLLVPSKLLSYMARGVPVIYVGPPGDTEEFVQRYNCGVSLRNGDVGGVARAIEELHNQPEKLENFSCNGLRAYEAELSLEHAMKKYDATIRSCVVADSIGR